MMIVMETTKQNRDYGLFNGESNRLKVDIQKLKAQR